MIMASLRDALHLFAIADTRSYRRLCVHGAIPLSKYGIPVQTYMLWYSTVMLLILLLYSYIACIYSRLSIIFTKGS